MKKCIDISKHQTAFNAVTCKNAGISTVICRLAYGAAVDQKLYAYAQLAKSEGMAVGGYGFATWHYKSLNNSNLDKARSLMRSQVTAWIDYAKKAGITSWFAIDQELEKKCVMGLSIGDNTTLLNEAADMIRSAGFVPCLYVGANWCMTNVNLNSFHDPLWIAYYKYYGTAKYFDNVETFPASSGTYGRWMNQYKNRICMWQFTSEGYASMYGCTHGSNNLDKNWMYLEPNEKNVSNEVKNDMSNSFDEYCLFPMACLRVTQGCGFTVDGVKASTYSHLYQTAYDIAGEDTGKSVLYAPFSCKVLRIYNGRSSASKCNFTWYVNTKRVLGANGVVYAPNSLFFMTAHCDTSFMNAHGIRVGAVFVQGQICGSEGTAGASGAHCHITFGTGTWDGKGWHEIKNRRGSWEINNPIYMHKVCYLKANCVVKNGFGYPWKTLNGNVSVPSNSTNNISGGQSGSASGNYFPKYTGNSDSIIVALKAVGADSSYDYRAKIAKVNGITGYVGSAQQNLTMVSLLKQGKLLKAASYFKKYIGNSTSITVALKAIGEDNSYSYREKIAAANNIRGYHGSAQQNLSMVDLLKKGILIKP